MSLTRVPPDVAGEELLCFLKGRGSLLSARSHRLYRRLRHEFAASSSQTLRPPLSIWAF